MYMDINEVSDLQSHKVVHFPNKIWDCSRNVQASQNPKDENQDISVICSHIVSQQDAYC